MFALLGAAAAVGSALAPPALPLANSTTVSGKARTRGNERTLLSIDPRRLKLQPHDASPFCSLLAYAGCFQLQLLAAGSARAGGMLPHPDDRADGRWDAGGVRRGPHRQGEQSREDPSSQLRRLRRQWHRATAQHVRLIAFGGARFHAYAPHVLCWTVQGRWTHMGTVRMGCVRP